MSEFKSIVVVWHYYKLNESNNKNKDIASNIFNI